MGKSGMITLEVCVLIALAAAALLVSERYFRGALQGHWRGNADSFSDEQFNPPDDEAIDPGSSAEYVKTSDSGIKVGNISIENPTLGIRTVVTGTDIGSLDLVSGAGSTNVQLLDVWQGGSKLIKLTDWKDK
ncbi:MAG: hypothetical protein NTU54_08235 [Candidatus Omnitrophica bacterium]|nr:hypothetical protein [Candidatus Omnitrophota bacterium]